MIFNHTHHIRETAFFQWHTTSKHCGIWYFTHRWSKLKIIKFMTVGLLLSETEFFYTQIMYFHMQLCEVLMPHTDKEHQILYMTYFFPVITNCTTLLPVTWQSGRFNDQNGNFFSFHQERIKCISGSVL